jgi:hypothetical protein
MSITWRELGIKGHKRIHDLWRQKDIGKARNAYSTPVNHHGVALVRLSPLCNCKSARGLLNASAHSRSQFYMGR